MESFNKYLFMSSEYMFEDQRFDLHKHQGDHLIVNMDPLTKEESFHDCSDTDISLTNFIDDDYVLKFQNLIDKNIRNSSILKEHLKNLSVFFNSMQKKIDGVEIDQMNLIKKIESSHTEKKELQNTNATLDKELKSLKSTRLVNYDQFKTIINKQKCANVDLDNKLKALGRQNEDLKTSIKEHETTITNKDIQIKLLEIKLSDTKEDIENEFKTYEDKIVDLVKQFEIEKVAKIRFYKIQNQEAKEKLVAKEKQITYFSQENRQSKNENEELKEEIASLKKSIKENMKTHETKITEELNKKISALINENSTLTQKNEFLNQSIKDLLYQVRELQAQVKYFEIKLIEPSQFFNNLQDPQQLSVDVESINNQRSFTEFSPTDLDLAKNGPQESLVRKSSSINQKSQSNHFHVSNKKILQKPKKS